jgi:CheY-like chemotaxis protein
LIGNSIKFHTKKNTEIMITVRREDRFCRVDVSDNGVGIPTDLKRHLFQQFMQLNNDKTQLFGGTGLGLSICKHIVECMGGEIWLESSELGVGSTFSFTFLLTEYDENNDLLKPAENHKRRKSLAGDDLSDCRILVAEDNAINRKVLHKMLEAIGIKHITMVNDGAQAVKEFSKQQYDLVILDIGMPVMNGVEAAIAIREHENIQERVPIMACTADVTALKHEECRRVGMDAVVTKPISRNELKSTIIQLLQHTHDS